LFENKTEGEVCIRNRNIPAGLKTRSSAKTHYFSGDLQLERKHFHDWREREKLDIN